MALEKDGDTCQVKGSGKKPYVLKNVGGVLSCDCMSWRNQSLPIDRRTCKHLKSIRGDAAEAIRVAAAFTGGMMASPTTTASPASKTRPLVGRGPTKPALKSGEFAPGVRTVEMDEDEEDVVGVRAVEMDEDEATNVENDAILARAASQGRKLRPDEKAKLNGPPVLLAMPFEDEDIDPTGYFFSEKLDGVRAYWNGEVFISRQGNVFTAPAWYTKLMPKHPLDGELWMGRRLFQKTISVVKSIDAGERWREVKYLVFDLPHLKTSFESRMRELKVIANWGPKWMTKVEQTRCDGLAHLKRELDRVVALGGEGLMLRKPGSLYVAARSDTLLKVKPWRDSEAKITGYELGKGRHKGRVGSLVVETRDGIEFKLGTGLSDENRRNPPPIGAWVTYRYMDLTDGGVPKGASYIATRDYE